MRSVAAFGLAVGVLGACVSQMQSFPFLDPDDAQGAGDSAIGTELGVARDGSPSPKWLAAIKSHEMHVGAIVLDQRPLTAAEAAWVRRITTYLH